MNRDLALIVIIASCLFAKTVFCADWKYYGEFTSAQDTVEVLFYDSDSIVSTNNSIKLWVKSLLYSDIEKNFGNKVIIEKSTKKTLNGYIPPISKIKPKTTNATLLEEVANDSATRSKSEILYQVVCSEGTFRKISGKSFNKNGVPDQRFGITKWEYIEPESNADNLAKILCLLK